MDLWVFAYGSLIWRPGFRFQESSHALIEGAHRALCLYSVHHRGMPKAPGLVFGLDKGGRCEGMVFRVAHRHAHETRLYLKRRENRTNTYHAITHPVKLLDGSGRTVEALCFFVDRHNTHYAGQLPLEIQAWLVRRSVGISGRNVDYVVNTMVHLRDLGVHDEELERLMTMLGHGIMKERCNKCRFNGSRPQPIAGHPAAIAAPLAASRPRIVTPPLNIAAAAQYKAHDRTKGESLHFSP